MKLSHFHAISLGVIFVVAHCLGARAADNATPWKDLPRGASGEHAAEVVASLRGGKGWMVVARQEKVPLGPHSPALPAVQYRFVTKYRAARHPNGEFAVQFLEFSDETSWLAVGKGFPTHSGSAYPVVAMGIEKARQFTEVASQIERLATGSSELSDRQYWWMVYSTERNQAIAMADLLYLYKKSAVQEVP